MVHCVRLTLYSVCRVGANLRWREWGPSTLWSDIHAVGRSHDHECRSSGTADVGVVVINLSSPMEGIDRKWFEDMPALVDDENGLEIEHEEGYT